MKLDELAARRIFESTLIMLPTKFRGATGAPVRIIALL
jgi:kynurenine formamidase